VLTLGGLIDKRYPYRKRTCERPLNYQKSAGAIVPIIWEGLKPKGVWNKLSVLTL
jgi:hypothetical protein